MNVYNLKHDDIFNKVNSNSTRDIDFYGPLNEYGIYDMNNYENIRPLLSEYLEDYKIEQTKNNYNREILLQHNREQSEIVKNMGEISITRDPRITKYEDTYSITPYATYMITPLSDIDGEDIVSRFDSCYGEWITKKKHECNADTEPCKRIKQHFRIHNLDYTGEHCRDKEGRRLRDNDNRHVFCNNYQNNSEKCGGHGKCVKNTPDNTCICDSIYLGSNCNNIRTCKEVENKGEGRIGIKKKCNEMKSTEKYNAGCSKYYSTENNILCDIGEDNMCKDLKKNGNIVKCLPDDNLPEDNLPNCSGTNLISPGENKCSGRLIRDCGYFKGSTAIDLKGHVKDDSYYECVVNNNKCSYKDNENKFTECKKNNI